jgi:hypothetical protein
MALADQFGAEGEAEVTTTGDEYAHAKREVSGGQGDNQP